MGDVVSDIRQEIQATHPDLYLHNESLLEVMQEGFVLCKHLSRDDIRIPNRSISLRLLDESQRSAILARNLWLDGYSVQSLAMSRMAFEFSITAEWISTRPNQALRFLREPEYNVSMRDKILALPSKEWRDNALTWYDGASVWVHPRYHPIKYSKPGAQPVFSKFTSMEAGNGLLTVLIQAILPLRYLISEEAGLVGYFAWSDKLKAILRQTEAISEVELDG